MPFETIGHSSPRRQIALRAHPVAGSALGASNHWRLSMLRSYRKSAGENFAERNNCLGTEQSHRLQSLVNEVQEVFVVAGLNFQKHIVLPGGVMAFDNFGYFFDSFKNLVELVGFLEEYADESACVVPKSRGFNQSAGTFENVSSLQFGNTLMDRRTTHTAFARDFQKRLAPVIDEHLENFGVEVVNL